MTKAPLSSSNLTPIQTAAFIAEHKRQRALLIEAFPELLEDQQALDDTLEGLSYAPDMIANIIRDAREDEANATALSIMIREMSDRKARFAARAERRYTMAQHLMDAIGLRKLAMPDFSASIVPTAPHVIVHDEWKLPHGFYKEIRQPDKAKIKEALKLVPVDGATLSNGGEHLTIRTK